MTGLVVGAIERVTKTWREEAAERRRISKSDPVADTLDYCAGEIATRLRTLATEAEYETVERRAEREGVTPQTVRAWIRAKQLPALEGPKGYRILASSVRIRSAS
jgi:hypothetical protein